MDSKRLPRRRSLLALPVTAPLAQSQTSPASRAPFIDEFWGPFERTVISRVPLRPTMSVLDLGCGSGTHLGFFAESLKAKGSVTGFDLRQDRLDVAAQKFGKHPHVKLRQGDLYEMPFSNASFDLVWSSHVFHGLTNIERAAQEVRRVLKPGGFVVLREDSSTTRFLPLDLGIGKPGVEGRVHQAFMEWFVEDRLKRGRYPYGWTHALTAMGLRGVRAEAILHQATPPFSESQKQYIGYSLRRRLEYPAVTAEDRETILAITDRANQAYALDRPDLHFIATSTIYIGQALGG